VYKSLFFPFIKIELILFYFNKASHYVQFEVFCKMVYSHFKGSNPARLGLILKKTHIYEKQID